MPRRPRTDEAHAIADVWLRARAAAVPSIPRPVHTDDEVKQWFATVVLPTREVWVIDHDDRIVALMVLHDGWIEQLYVDPPSARLGLGSRLLELAKELNPHGLDLWTFQANTGARRFYERHGFVAVDSTDGDNEEGAPDVRYRWPGAGRRSLGRFAVPAHCPVTKCRGLGQRNSRRSRG